jgi:DNA topoisomerase-1
VRDATTLARIRALVIPPNWRDVWICPSSRGHIQATGRDARGRKQYLYHARYRVFREQTKFGRMAIFGRALPRIRSRLARDLRRPGLTREKVLATVVRLLDMTRIRVGNEEYARENGSYGLTTMRDRHVRVRGSTVQFRFRAKSGKECSITLDHPRLARVVKRCRDLPGYELFQYVDDSGSRVSVDSNMVNDYLREITGEEFSAKDFRTWHGTVRAMAHLSDCGEGGSETAIKRNVVAALKQVAEELGNLPSTCRKYYVHPGLVDAYSEGVLARYTAVRSVGRSNGLSGFERGVMSFLRSFDHRSARRAKAA